MTAVRIRPCRGEDVEALTEMAIRSWLHAYEGVLTPRTVREAPHRLARTISSGWHHMHVAEADDRIIGYFNIEPGSNHIRHIYLDPDYHRRGIGRLMMEAALDTLREKGFAQASIDVVAGTDASEFHRVMGWRETARREDREGVTVVSMVKDL